MMAFPQLRSPLQPLSLPSPSSPRIKPHHPHPYKKPWKMLITIFLGTLHISLSVLHIDFLSIGLETAVHIAMLMTAVHLLRYDTFFNNCLLHGATKSLCWLSLIQSLVMLLDSPAHGGVVSCIRQVVRCGTTWCANVAVLVFLSAIQCKLSGILHTDKEQPSRRNCLTRLLHLLAACAAVFFAVCTVLQLEFEEPCVYKAVEPWRTGAYISVAAIVLPLAFRCVGLVALTWKLPYSCIKHVTIHASLAVLVFIIVPWGVNLWMLYTSVWYWAAAYFNQWVMIAGIVALHHVSEVLEPLGLTAATLIDKQTGRMLSLCDRHRRLLKCKKGENIRNLVVQSDLHVFETVFCDEKSPVVVCIQPDSSCLSWTAAVSATWLGGSVWSLKFQDIRDLRDSARLQPYQALLENLREAVVVFDADMVVTFANAAMCRLVGFGSVGDALGKSHNSIFCKSPLLSSTNPADPCWQLAKMRHEHGTEVEVYATTTTFGVGSQAVHMVFAHKDDPSLRHASVKRFIDGVNDKVINPISTAYTMIADSLEQLEEFAQADISRSDGNPMGELLSKHAALLHPALELICAASRQLITMEDVVETDHQLRMSCAMPASASTTSLSESPFSTNGESQTSSGQLPAAVRHHSFSAPNSIRQFRMSGTAQSSSSGSRSVFGPRSAVLSCSTKSDGSTSSTLFAPAPRPAPPSLSMYDWNVMVVDDSLINQKLLKIRFTESDVFAPAKWNVICVSTGEEAVRQVKQSSSFQLITMDKNLAPAGGDLDGWETTIAIRALERHKQLKPAIIIGATTHTSKQDIAEAKLAGQNHVWSKPYPTAHHMYEALQYCAMGQSAGDGSFDAHSHVSEAMCGIRGGSPVRTLQVPGVPWLGDGSPTAI